MPLASNHTSRASSVVLVSYHHLQAPSTRATSALNRAVMVARSTTAVTLPTAGSETTEV